MNRKAVLETERLSLHEFAEASPEEAAFVARLLNDPDFLRYIGDRGVRTPAQACDYLRNGPLASYRANGFGLYRVVRKADGASMGMCGLLRRPTLAHADLGYALLPEFRGQGYVAEAAAGVLAQARDELRMDTVLAVVDPANTASIRLLDGLGFFYRQPVRLAEDDIELHLFAWKPER